MTSTERQALLKLLTDEDLRVLRDYLLWYRAQAIPQTLAS